MTHNNPNNGTIAMLIVLATSAAVLASSHPRSVHDTEKDSHHE